MDDFLCITHSFLNLTSHPILVLPSIKLTRLS